MPVRIHNFGGHTGRETPLPIPNRAVKPARADGTRRATSRESRSPPMRLAKPPLSGRLRLLRPRCKHFGRSTAGGLSRARKRLLVYPGDYHAEALLFAAPYQLSARRTLLHFLETR